MRKILIAIILSFTIAGLTAGEMPAVGQQTQHPGIVLFNNGKFDEAITVLENAVTTKEYRSNGEIWNTLGLAYIERSDLKKAGRAFDMAVKFGHDKAAYHSNVAFVLLNSGRVEDALSEAKLATKLDPNNLNAYLILGKIYIAKYMLDEAEQNADALMRSSPQQPAGYVLKSNVLLARLSKAVSSGWDVADEIDLLRQASDVLKTGLDKCSASPMRRLIVKAAEPIAIFYEYFSKDPPPDVPADPSVKPLKIITRARPVYNELARWAGITGTVKVAVLFGTDGRVKYTLIIKGIGFGLDESAARAAMQFKFEPQTVGGKPVATVRIIDFPFGEN